MLMTNLEAEVEVETRVRRPSQPGDFNQLCELARDFFEDIAIDGEGVESEAVVDERALDTNMV